MVGAIRLWTEVSVRVDNPSATAGEGEHGRGRAWRLGTFVGFLLTGRAERFVDEAGERFGLYGAFSSALVGFKGRLGEELVGPPDMNEEADEDERNHEELVKQQVWRHDDVPSHDGERRRCYCISPLTYYPLVAGTPPVIEASGGFEVVRTQRGFRQGQGALVNRLGLGIAALSAGDARQGAQRLDTE